MRFILYTVWLLPPLFFFGTALWSWLEKATNPRKKTENPADFFRQGIFVLLCVAACIIFDQTYLETLVDTFSPSFLPLVFWQVILFPIALLAGARLVGGSKEISRKGKGAPRRK